MAGGGDGNAEFPRAKRSRRNSPALNVLPKALTGALTEAPMEVPMRMRRGEVMNKCRLERADLMAGAALSLDDEYILRFANFYPNIFGRQKWNTCVDKRSPEYIPEKAKLYGSIIGNLEGRIKRERGYQALCNTFLSRGAYYLHKKIAESEKRVADFENLKQILVLFKRNYEKFADDRGGIEKDLLSKIGRGEVEIPGDFPYVMLVNRAKDEQYAVIYKYDAVTRTLDFQTCNMVSTGDAYRWVQEGPYDHSTPDAVFYIGGITGLNNSSIQRDSEAYGAEFVDRDKKPYQLFRLFTRRGGKFEKTSYMIHPTNEESLLGRTASHGCIRITRMMDEQMVGIFDKWYRDCGIYDFAKFPPTVRRFDNPKMPVVVRGV